MRKGEGSWLEAGRRSGAVPAEQPGGDSIREVLMTQQQQQQKRKGGERKKRLLQGWLPRRSQESLNQSCSFHSPL